MKKLLLVLVAFTMALAMNAQASAKAELADNQQLLGYYLSDKLNRKGFGLPEWGENEHCKAAIKLTADMLKPYVGMKIVNVRFGLSYKLDKSRVFITSLTNGYEGEDVVSQDVASTVADWNNVALDTPYYIEKDKSILVGFDFAQKTRMKGLYYSAECYPLSVVEEGITTMPILIYGDSGNGEYWHEIGTRTGNLSIQVIIEGSIEKYSVTAFDFKVVQGEINKPAEAKVKVTNNGKDAVSKLNYVVYVDGKASAEQEATLENALEPGNTGTFNAVIPAVDSYGKKAVKIEITKVNGNDNTAENKTANGFLGVPQEFYPRNVVIEEFTTEKCGNCPRVAADLHKALASLDKERVFAVAHHSAYGTDWLTQPCDEEMYGLMFNGMLNSFAPAMMFNRDCDAIPDDDDSKTGNVFLPVVYAQISGYAQILLNKQSNSQLQMDVTYDGGIGQASIVVKGKCNEAYDLDNSYLTLYLLEDSIMPVEQNSAPKGYRHMHVIRYYNSTWGDKVEWNDDYSFEKKFDVDIFTGWEKKNLQFVAFLNGHNDNDYSDNKIDNAVGMRYSGVSGIDGMAADNESHQVARYTIEGMETTAPVSGLNIIKLSDGRTVKVLVK